jgi:hypothetical protein
MNLTLAGDPAGGTILHPPAGAPGITLGASAATVTIQDLTISGANISAGGGAISTDHNTTLMINHCTLTNNTGTYGGAVFLSGGSLAVTNSVIQDNHATWDGGGIYSGAQLTLSNTLFKGNSADRHGGGAHGNTWVSMIGGTFENNTAGGNGGGLNLNDDLYISHTSFLHNSAGSDGGGVLQWNPNVSVSIYNATFTDNTAQNTGGGMAAKGNMDLHGGIFLRNIAGTETRQADSAGGGLYLEAGSLSLTGTTFQENKSLTATGYFSEGGGLLVANPSPTINHVTGAQFIGNDAWLGGGLSQTKRDSDGTYGSLVLEESTFQDNTGGYGGGLGAINATVSDSLFYGNAAVVYGGGMQAANSTIERSRFINNSTPYGSSAGAGLYITGNNITLRNTAFVGNHQVVGGNAHGNAILIGQYSGTVTVQQVTLNNNTGGDGSGLYVQGGTVTMKNAIVANQVVGVCVYGGSAYLEGTLWYANTTNMGSGTACPVAPSWATQYTGNPAFGPDGYHITPGSLAVNHGVFLASITDDIDGDHRPRDVLYDIGADELNYFVWLPVTIR